MYPSDLSGSKRSNEANFTTFGHLDFLWTTPEVEREWCRIGVYGNSKLGRLAGEGVDFGDGVGGAFKKRLFGQYGKNQSQGGGKKGKRALGGDVGGESRRWGRKEKNYFST